jgi:two-component system, chemotaxis family, CheB/CheR fusion protein
MTPSPLQRLRILIIEDSVEAAETQRQLLGFQNHMVEAATCGAEDIERARQFSREVVLCDIGLSDMDEYAVARELATKEVVKGCYLIAFSGYAQRDDIDRSKKAGFHTYLAKPNSINAIENIIGEVAFNGSK